MLPTPTISTCSASWPTSASTAESRWTAPPPAATSAAQGLRTTW